VIPFRDFSALRLARFTRPGDDVVRLEEWEFQDDVWVGEALGLTQFLRRRSDPASLRAVGLDLDSLPDAVTQNLLDAMDLPLRFGMDEAEVRGRMGAPAGTVAFAGTSTLEFEVRVDDGAFCVSCTVDPQDGLVYLDVAAREPRPLLPGPRDAADASGA
jgi:hypothetical protein